MKGVRSLAQIRYYCPKKPCNVARNSTITIAFESHTQYAMRAWMSAAQPRVDWNPAEPRKGLYENRGQACMGLWAVLEGAQKRLQGLLLGLLSCQNPTIPAVGAVSDTFRVRVKWLFNILGSTSGLRGITRRELLHRNGNRIQSEMTGARSQIHWQKARNLSGESLTAEHNE